MNETNQTEKAPRQLTEGEVIMGLTFNPSKREDVDYIKKWCADRYDWLSRKTDVPMVQDGKDIGVIVNRMKRLASIAKTFLETFQMDAVKALTFTEEFPINFTRVEGIVTEGMIAMTHDFNVGGRQDVRVTKSSAALMHDTLQQQSEKRSTWFKQKEREYQKSKHPNNEMPTPESIAWTPELTLLADKVGASHGAMGDALYNLRHYQMYAVKAMVQLPETMDNVFPAF